MVEWSDFTTSVQFINFSETELGTKLRILSQRLKNSVWTILSDSKIELKFFWNNSIKKCAGLGLISSLPSYFLQRPYRLSETFFIVSLLGCIANKLTNPPSLIKLDL